MSFKAVVRVLVATFMLSLGLSSGAAIAAGKKGKVCDAIKTQTSCSKKARCQWTDGKCSRLVAGKKDGAKAVGSSKRPDAAPAAKKAEVPATEAAPAAKEPAAKESAPAGDIQEEVSGDEDM